MNCRYHVKIDGLMIDVQWMTGAKNQSNRGKGGREKE